MNRREAIKKAAWMSGIALSAPSLVAALQGCSTDLTPDWTPAFFTDEEAVLVAELAETILPRTDTPGAKDALVHRFLDMWMSEYVPAESSAQMRESLRKFDETARSEHGSPFVDLDAATKLALVKRVNEEALQNRPGTQPPAGSTFPNFIDFKEAVFVGFFTSQLVGEDVLAYNPIPGDYVGCLPLEEATGGKVWSL